jgi:hypothetical protein
MRIVPVNPHRPTIQQGAPSHRQPDDTAANHGQGAGTQCLFPSYAGMIRIRCDGKGGLAPTLSPRSRDSRVACSSLLAGR